MFQTSPISWVQSFSTPLLTYFMQALTLIGYPTFYIIFILILFSSIDYKKGWELLQLILLGALLTLLGKDFFSYPRPFYLDESLKLLDPFLLKKDFPLIKGFKDLGFFDLIPSGILEEFRKVKGAKFGFPSGHTSLSVCFWGYLYQVYKEKKSIKYLSLFMIFGVPFSRIYLGVHFIGDILGGYLLGLLTFILFRVKTSKWIFLFRQPFKVASWSYFFLLPFCSIFFLSPDNLFIACYFLGINLNLFVLKSFEARKILDIKATKERIIFALVTIFTFFLIRVLFKNLLFILGLNGNIILEPLRHILTAFLGFFIPIYLLQKRFGVE